MASFDEILNAAEGGDARAQYAIAAMLARSGRRDEADRWLQRAAASGDAEALYTLATRDVHTIEGAVAARPTLEKAAARSVAAARLLAVLKAMRIGGAEDDRSALAVVLDHAQRGEASAQREIAGLLMLRDPEDADAAALLALAAGRDPVTDAVAAARLAAGRRVGDSAAAHRGVERLARANYPRAAYLAEALVNASDFAIGPSAPDWAAIAAKAGLTSAKIASTPLRLLDSPRVDLRRSVIAPELCEYVIAHSAPLLRPATVFDSRDGKTRRDDVRTSTTAALAPIDLDLVIVAINRIMASLAGLPDENGEFLSVMRYAPGQEYRPHHDCLPPGPDLDRSGQRVRTALLYLNGDYEGGETRFLASALNVKGERGDILVFSNVLADGKIDLASRHAGLPVRAGEKWLASRWIRSQNYMF